MASSSKDNTDLENYSKNFMRLIEIQRTKQDNEKELLQFIELLSMELTVLRDNAKKNETEMQRLLKILDNSSPLKYLSLQGIAPSDECANLNQQIKCLNKKLDDANLEFIHKETILKQRYENELAEMQAKYKEELLNCEKQSKLKEQQLIDENQGLQSLCAIQVDEVETRLNLQLEEVNAKLRDSQNCCSNLRNELYKLKSQYNFNRSSEIEKYEDLKKELASTKKLLNKTTEPNKPSTMASSNPDFKNLAPLQYFDVDPDDYENFEFTEKENLDFNFPNKIMPQNVDDINSDNVEHRIDYDNKKEKLRLNDKQCTSVIEEKEATFGSNIKNSKYQPLNVFTTNNNNSDDIIEDSETETVDLAIPSRKLKVTVFRGDKNNIGKNKNNNRIIQKNSLPPLKQCSVSVQESKPQTSNYSRKRKLFNPNDLDYLEGLELPK